MSNKAMVRTCLWFDGDGEAAIEAASRPEPGKPAMIVELSLAGTPYTFLSGLVVVRAPAAHLN